MVNNQVISNQDLNDRVAIAMNTTGIPDTEENRARLTPQILRQLVDEQLQMEEGAKENITISDERVREGIAQIERQSEKPAGSLEQFLAMRGLSKSSFYAQIRAQMTWADIVMKKIRPRIHISDQEIAHYVARKAPAAPVAHKAEAAPLAREVKIAVLVLPVDSAQNEPKMRKVAIKLAEQIHAGVKFEAVAAQFSSSTGNTRIAEPFWVETAQIDPIIAKAISGLPKGGVSAPVRSANGYQIIKLVDYRRPIAVAKKAKNAPETAPVKEGERIELSYKQILMNMKPDAQVKEAELLLKLSKEVAHSPGKCTEKSLAGASDLASVDFTVTLNRALSEEIPEKLRDLLLDMKPDEVSEPIVTPEGIRLFMLCERKTLAPETAAAKAESTAAANKQALFVQKLELEAQKHMRDLRKEAFVETRVQ